MSIAASQHLDKPASEAGTSPVVHAADWAWNVGGVVLLVYGLYLGLFFAWHHDVRQFIFLRKSDVALSHASSVIKYDPHFPYATPLQFYDGGAYYLMALDPANARYYLPQGDAPYRYTKIGYPIAARLLALGSAPLIPYTMVLINLLSVAFGAMVLGTWLKRMGRSPWWALAYGLYFGLFIGFARDLAEPMSYAFAILGIYLLQFGRKYRVLLAGLAFAVAILARDKVVIFPAFAALALLYGGSEWRGLIRPRTLLRNAREPALLLLIAVGPYLAYRVFLHFWMGTVAPEGNQLTAPLQGTKAVATHPFSLLVQVPTVYTPAVILTFLSVRALWNRIWRLEIVLLLITIFFSTLVLGDQFFNDPYGSTRVAISVVLAAFLCIPAFDRLTVGSRTWLAVCSGCWVLFTAIFFVFMAFGVFV